MSDRLGMRQTRKILIGWCAVAMCLILGGMLARADEGVTPAPERQQVSDQTRQYDSGPGDAGPGESAEESAEAESTGKQQVFSGEVVAVREELKRRGINASSELDAQFALKTESGELLPIVPDWRGRAFFQDEKLRNRRVDLVGSRREGLPYLQVLMIFTFDDQGQRQYTDYWCDICAIPMYEIKRCECCQGDVRLRFQPRGLPDFVERRSDSADDAAEVSAPTRHRPADESRPTKPGEKSF